MSKTLINFFLDAALLVVLCGLIWTSLTLRFVFPAATTADGWTLWGLSYDGWATAQFVFLCVILLGILLHVMLHWGWVCNVVAARFFNLKGKDARPDDGAQTIYGVATLIAIFLVLGSALAVASVFVRAPVE